MRRRAGGQRQAAVGPSVATRLVKLENSGTFWEMPAWYAEKVAQLAQEVFRLHAFVSAISGSVSRALFVDRVTAHRLTRGQPEDHRTLIKGALHRASGGCACLLHKSAAPAERFVRLEFRMEFCGCALGANGRCPTHSLAEHTPQSAKFPGVCMLGLKVELRCAHEQAPTGATGGVRLPLDVRDAKMDLQFTRPFVLDVASCAARLMLADPPYADLQLDADAAFAEPERPAPAARARGRPDPAARHDRRVLASEAHAAAQVGPVRGARERRVQRHPEDAQAPVQDERDVAGF